MSKKEFKQVIQNSNYRQYKVEDLNYSFYETNHDLYDIYLDNENIIIYDRDLDLAYTENLDSFHKHVESYSDEVDAYLMLELHYTLARKINNEE